MRFFRWAGVHPVAVVLVIAATIAVLLVVNADDSARTTATNPSAVSDPASPIPGDLISEPGLGGWEHTGAGRFEATGKGERAEYTTRGGPGVLWFGEEVGDFDLTLEFMIEEPEGNSGVFVRLQTPEDAASLEDALEIQITTEETATGVEATGAVYGLEDPLVYFHPIPGRWHEMHVRALGMQVFVSFDDVQVAQFPSTTDPDAVDWGPTGYIGLQNHSKEDVVHFRNVRLAEL